MFSKINEAKITKAILEEFSNWFKEYITSDVIIVGGGPSGLMAGHDIAKAGFKVLLVESNNYLGGGFWIGGYLMNILTFRDPSQRILGELGITYRKVEEGLYATSGPNACSKLISAACDAGLEILNMTKVEDVIHRNGKIEGAVINWTPVSALPRAITCVDPVSIESKIVIDCTGHDASVLRKLEERGLLRLSNFGPMDVITSEDMIVEKTGVIYPGLIAAGMSVSTAFGIPRMGPTFGGMLFSGRKAAKDAINLLTSETSDSGIGMPQEEVINI